MQYYQTTVVKVVSAIQWTGENLKDIINSGMKIRHVEEDMSLAIEREEILSDKEPFQLSYFRVQIGDWIIRSAGKLKFVTKDSFEKDYSIYKNKPTSVPHEV